VGKRRTPTSSSRKSISKQRQRDLKEAQLAIEKAKIALGVLIFPNFSRTFQWWTICSSPRCCRPSTKRGPKPPPPVPTSRPRASDFRPPAMRCRWRAINICHPFALRFFFYGINANQFAARTHYPPEGGHEVPYRQNLGMRVRVTLNIPVWNWGATRSKVKQAEFQARSGPARSLDRAAYSPKQSRYCVRGGAGGGWRSSSRCAVQPLLRPESLRLTAAALSGRRSHRARGGGCAEHRDTGSQRL